MIDRRQPVAGASLATLLGGAAWAKESADMYGMIGKITATPGRRADLTKLLLAGSGAMPGCLSYVVSEDLADADALWVAEAWDSKDSHAASLALPAVRDAIAKARPLIAGFTTAAELRPIGGVGLVTREVTGLILFHPREGGDPVTMVVVAEGKSSLRGVSQLPGFRRGSKGVLVQAEV